MKYKVLSLLLCLFGLSAAHAECAYDTEKSMLSRVVAVDSSNGAIYGGTASGEQASAPSPLALNDKEIVLTFDQGPHAKYTDYILFSLDKFCVKAVFFFSGSAAAANPAMVREVAARGHTVAAGSWSHAPDFTVLSPESARSEVEKGFAALEKVVSGNAAPFFRGSPKTMPAQLLAHLKDRGVSLWSYDIASGDTEPGITPAESEVRVMTKLRELGKGVIQFHDTSKITVDALDDILSEAKQNGFKVVQPVAVVNFVPKPEYLINIAKSDPEPQKSADQSRASRGLAEEARRRVRLRNAEERDGVRASPPSHSQRVSRRTAEEAKRKARQRYYREEQEGRAQTGQRRVAN